MQKSLGGTNLMTTWKFSQDSVMKSITEIIIVDELLFKFVEDLGFKKLMASTCPRFSVPSTWTVARDSYQLYVHEKTKLMNKLKTTCFRACLTTDTWTSV